MTLIDTSVGQEDAVPLNSILEFEFSAHVAANSVRPDTIQVRPGPNYGRQVPGDFRVEGSRVYFYPQLPVTADLSDAGLQPDTEYRVTLPGHPTSSTVRSKGDDRLSKERVLVFRTASSAAPLLFQDNFLDAAPPRVMHVSPADGAIDVNADAPVILTFNRRPLLPVSVNEGNITLTMVSRRGVPVNRPVMGDLVLIQNHDSVQVEFKPRYPLADEAVYALKVDRRVQDLLGNDVEEFESAFTIRDEPIRDSELVYAFDAAEKEADCDLDASTASWSEQVDGALAALFTVAGGNGTAGDLRPTTDLTISPDDLSRGVTIEMIDNVEYDVFNYRSIDIPAGVTVRFVQRADGTNRPIRLLALKTIRIDGVLDICGEDGDNGESQSYSKNMSNAYGGVSGPGGGDGASAYTGTLLDNVPSMDGDDVDYGGEGGHGGGSGTYSYSGSYEYRISYAGGGGGGGSRLDGQDGKKGGYNYNSNYCGKAGKGGDSTAERGYPENEAREPNVGGAGGGAGGKGFYYYKSSYSSTEYNDNGAGGGGGGGAITVQSASDVVIGSTGQILADGGAGGGTSNSSSYYGGAGGGGGGGSILVRATAKVTLQSQAKLSVAGGDGGGFTSSSNWYIGGEGGAGGDGYLRIEAREDENNPGSPLIEGTSQADLTYGPVSVGTFAPEGGGAPSVGQTLWRNLGVFDPIVVRPTGGDILSELYNDTMTIEVQMAVEDQNDLGNPDLSAMDIADSDGDGNYDDSLDLSKLSEWTRIYDIEDLNDKGYQFLRVRVTFQLDDAQTADEPLPYLDYLRIPFRF
jgi:hypothetical protein